MTRASDTAKLLGAGATILDGTTISTADNTDQLILKSTDADANVGPVLRLNRDSGSPADNDLIGSIIFQADDDGGNTTNLVEFITQIEDASNGSESADLHISTRRLGSLVSRIGMYNSTTVINEDSADIDFRVESNGQANMFVVDAGNDTVSFTPNSGNLAIKAGRVDSTNNVRLEAGGTTSTYLEYRGYLGHIFDVDTTERMRIDSAGRLLLGTTTEGQATADDLTVATSSHTGITIRSGTTNEGNVFFSDGTSGDDEYRGYVQYRHNDNSMRFGTNAVTRMTIDSSGDIFVPRAWANTTGGSANMRVLDANGGFARSTSSLKYKNTVNDATHGLTELLTLRPVTYKGNNDGDTVFGGLIAEEVHDAGLTEFVEYNDENQPDALHYGNMVSLCIKAIQELKAENIALTNRITALEGA